MMTAVLVCCCMGAATGKPNFIIMMSDDQGYNDLGRHGNPDLETPHLDSLAAESVELSTFYSNDVCAPTRASLLTGRYFLRTGVWGVHGARDYLNLDENTFADALRTAGYKTGLFGKWHNGLTDGYLPWDRGFDEACMVELYIYVNNKAICNGNERATEGWVTERIVDWGIDFMERNRDQPFLLYLPFMTPHLGKTWHGESEYWHAPEEIVNKYRSKGLSDGLSRLYGSIDFMDHNIGRVMQSLDSLGLAENTVVIFLSDNGPIGQAFIPHNEWIRRNPDGLNGNKGEIYDNGIRVPMFVRWRGTFPPNVVDRAITGVEDIFPTVIELAGAQSGGKPLDGKSMVPMLNNPFEVGPEWTGRTLFRTIRSPEWTRRDGIYHLLPNRGTDKSQLILGSDGRWAVREGQYKLVNLAGFEFLYDMWNDPTETSPIYDGTKQADLHNKLAQWWDEMVADPGSFATPSFYIGWSGEGVIAAMGTMETSQSIVVRTHNVEGWVNSGDSLKYKVHVVRSGSYNVHINKWSWFGNARVSVTCGDQGASVSGWVSNDGFIGTVSLTEGRDCLMEVVIETGGGFLGMDKISFVG